MRIVCCWKYHTLFVIFEKAENFNCRLLQIIGGALWVNILIHDDNPISFVCFFMIIELPFC